MPSLALTTLVAKQSYAESTDISRNIEKWSAPRLVSDIDEFVADGAESNVRVSDVVPLLTADRGCGRPS